MYQPQELPLSFGSGGSQIPRRACLGAAQKSLDDVVGQPGTRLLGGAGRSHVPDLTWTPTSTQQNAFGPLSVGSGYWLADFLGPGRAPCIETIPISGLKSFIMTYFGVFGALGPASYMMRTLGFYVLISYYGLGRIGVYTRMIYFSLQAS